MRRLLIAVVLCSLPCWGQQVGKPPRTVPSVFALRGATVAVGNGEVLSNATVIVSDGLITAVGADVPVPPSAWELDLKGKFVYPGLIDGLTEVGLKRPATRTPQAQPQVGEGPPVFGEAAGRSIPNGGMLAHIQAADLIDDESKDLAAWRESGVLTIHLAPDQGIFMGQTAVLNLNGQDGRSMIVRSPVTSRVSFRGLGFSTYPGSLMGVIAVLRQTLIDARHYGEVTSIYSRHPAGLKRPATDRVLEALQPVVSGSMPLIFPAKTEREIQRALDLARSQKVKCIIAGGFEAARLAPRLKQDGIPVLVSLNFPQKDREGNPEAEESLETLLSRHQAPRAAAKLQAAGVMFAFYSDGLKNARDFVRNLRLAVKKGLPQDAALRAASLSAAEILGVDRQSGSIEPGKIANLIVADRNLFDDKARITQVFVDGEIFEVPPETERARPDEPRAEAAKEKEKEDQEITFEIRPPSGAREILIRNANIMTVTQGTLKNACLLIQDGKIAAVGQNLAAPPDAEVIDAAGKWITPGIVDCHNHIAADSTNEGSVAVSSMTGIEDVLDPTDINIYRDLAGGVTVVHVLHGSANPIGGKDAVIKLRWGEPVERLLFSEGVPGLKFALGENPKRPGTVTTGATRRYPTSRMGVEDVIRSAFLEAREYDRQWQEYEKQKAAGVTPLLPPRRDLRLEPIVELLKGKRLMNAHAYRADEMLMLIRLAEEFGFKINTFDHGLEGYKIAKEITAHGASVTTFSDWWAYKFEAYDAIPYNAALLARKGVLVSLNSDGAEESRHLLEEATKCMKYGNLTENEALAMVTLNPARQLRIDHRVGSLEPGKDADLVIFNRYPLSVYAVPETVFIDGKIYFSRERDKEQQKRLEETKKRLTDLEKAEPRRPPEDRERREPTAQPVSAMDQEVGR